MVIKYQVKKVIQWAIVLWISPLLLGAVSVPRITKGPEQLPHVLPVMKSPDYWIAKLENPDEVLCTAKQIHELERHWKSRGLIHDLFAYHQVIRQAALLSLLKSDYSYLKRVGRFRQDGSRMQASDYARIKKNVNTPAVQVSNSVRWGMTVRRTALRLFPTQESVTNKPLDLEFNALLHSGLHLAEPVVVLHTSFDGAWYFVDSAVGFGWVQISDVALAGKSEQVFKYCQRATWVVAAHEALFEDASGELPAETARMGCRLALDPKKKQHFELPQRDAAGKLFFQSGKLRTSAAMLPQTRPLTPRGLIEQAFVVQAQTYGWGGGSGYGDCSEMIRRIGLVCGIEFPRSTSALKRGLHATRLTRDPAARKRQLAASPGGRTLLYMPGHIMLVLGTVAGRTYVMHNLYGIHDYDVNGDFIRRVARVLVSDLSLGKHSRKGTLHQRITHRLEIKPGLDKERNFE